MTNVHVLACESLGGVLREYVEVDRKTLEPTNIIHADGKRYRMVDRKANVGEKVFDLYDRKSPIKTIISVPYNSDTVWYSFETENGRDTAPLCQYEYRVLEPLPSPEELCGYFDGDDADSQLTDQLDIIARLTRKVAQLERENTDIKRDLETWVQEVERLKRKLDDDRRDIEMVIDDIVTLDERTQPEELAKKLVEVITKGLNAIDSRYFGY